MEPWVREVLLPIVLPAIAALYSCLADIWGCPYDKPIQLIRERRYARDSENGKCSGAGSNRRNRKSAMRLASATGAGGEAAGGTIVLHYMPHELVGQYFEEVS